MRRADFVISKLSGRLNTLLDTDEKLAVLKFDGWPEILVQVTSSSKSKSDAWDKNLTATISEALTSSIRNSVLEVECAGLKKFPVSPKVEPFTGVSVVFSF